ncbi:MmcQ/YjbR family DNA-binding protein [Ferruginibacter lapsinanis]|uniref:MmcQ/YjbR family DNA-binding protein n=1 Tax=Ferruginibacter lapsinanis TaxID=563172 RepID=UPI001E4A2943|nr:MmcQ/YjbR family DNA-binding protein [Ferruginibacter lapsinanis]UEG50226.1 MmcQ/YjbR family DNA-binding protein [Ferruginibacter lapsinanis]
MNIETLRDYVLQKPNVTEGFPFGDAVVVFKVNGKMFLLVPLDTEQLQFNAKCDPDHAIELREQYDCVQPGFHMNKKHWNTVIVDGTIKNNQLLELVDESYDLVSKKKK